MKVSPAMGHWFDEDLCCTHCELSWRAHQRALERCPGKPPSELESDTESESDTPSVRKPGSTPY